MKSSIYYFHLKTKILEDFQICSSVRLRYVDDILAAFDNEQYSLNLLDFLNKRHPNIKFTTEKQVNHFIAFLDVFISGINNQNLTFQKYHKSTNTGLL